MIHESSVEPGRLQGTPSGKVTNPSDAVESSLGWGIVQWTPAGKMIKPSRQAGIDDATIVSLQYQLDFLRKQLNGETAIPEKNAGDQMKAAKTVEDAAVAFGRYYERFAGSDDLSNSRYTERKTAAKQVLSTFGAGAPASGGGCGAGSGNIAAVAKTPGLADPGTRRTDKPYAEHATDSTRRLLPKYNNRPRVRRPRLDRLRAVRRDRDADERRRPRLPRRVHADAGELPAHLREVRRARRLTISKLQPGDILIGPGHTYLFVGPWGNGYNSAAGVAWAATCRRQATRTTSGSRRVRRRPAEEEVGSSERMLEENRRPFLIGVTAVVIAVVLIGGYLLFRGEPESKLTVTSIPNDLTLTLDGTQIAANGEIKVKAGTHTLTAERKGFESYSQTVTAADGDPLSVKMYLYANSAGRARVGGEAPGADAAGRGGGRAALRRDQRAAARRSTRSSRRCRTSGPASRRTTGPRSPTRRTPRRSRSSSPPTPPRAKPKPSNGSRPTAGTPTTLDIIYTTTS